MNFKSLNKKLSKMNLYEIHQKILNGKQTSWMENALYAGFTPDEIVSMIEANLEQLQSRMKTNKNRGQNSVKTTKKLNDYKNDDWKNHRSNVRRLARF